MRAAASPEDVAAFPWEAAMGFGLGVLCLSPATFWSLTPRELAAAVRGRMPGGNAPARPPDRAAFGALMARFPD
ncbi:rcc01693 family protein [Segnochrobactraceae bacterium EtOH-i3]